MSIETYPEVKLTQYSHGAGCGCKISPKLLDEILKSSGTSNQVFPGLLVGNSEKDDAAVLDLKDGTALISTTDFFMPIVDDAFEFGRIAATNAISDVYAMGGKPVLAIAILGWPIDKLSAEVAGKVIEGARYTCQQAGIPLAGGHSIDCPEPIFGLSVNGRVNINDLKKNGGDIANCVLYLTKGLGVGILTTAEKKTKLKPEHNRLAPESMMKLNTIGEVCGSLDYIKAMTDVTGFGLMGHLVEMCEASNQSAVVELSKVPLIDRDAIKYYLEEKCVPGGTNRNYDSYGDKIEGIEEEFNKNILCDPQTSGGLLIAVEKDNQKEFEIMMKSHDLDLKPLGYIIPKDDKTIKVVL
ncbi:MAG TPA: selenide, water dikinase SelD [Saprospiraceae bacterium]|nr:selenide, water dikinase SelD [Saprospiraceae bacterium]